MKRLFVLALLLVATVSSAADVALMPSLTARFLNSTGTAALAGGYVVTCPAGSTCGCYSWTSKTTYTDSTGLIANSNPIYLNAKGEADIWLDTGNGSYKITVCDRYGAVQKSEDGVFSVSQVSSAITFSEWLATSLIPVYISPTQFSVSGDHTSTFTVGRRIKLLGTVSPTYHTVVASSFSGGVTTITVISDSYSVDSGLSTVYTGILDPSYPSSPIVSSVTLTNNYTMTPIDCGKNFITSPTTTGMVVTLPSVTSVPNGCEVRSVATTTWGVTYSGNINSNTTTTLYQYDSLRIRSSSTGTIWNGEVITRTPGPADVIPATVSGGTISTGFIPFASQGLMYAGWPVSVAGPIVISGGTGTLASAGTWTVSAGDVFYLAGTVGMVSKGSVTGSVYFQLATDPTISIYSAPAGVTLNGFTARYGADTYFPTTSEIPMNASATILGGLVPTVTAIGVVTSSGDLNPLFIGKDVGGGTGTQFQNIKFYLYWLKKKP